MTLTAAEIAAFLGVSASAVRHAVRRHDVHPVDQGRNGARLYRASDVLRHTGTHDRMAV